MTTSNPRGYTFPGQVKVSENLPEVFHEKNASQSLVRIYPNPISGNFRIEKIGSSINAGDKVQVLGLAGEIVFS